MTRPPIWNVPLEHPPLIRAMGTPIHGHSPIERWKNIEFWTLHAYHYSAKVRVNQTWLQIEPGVVSIFPAGVELEYRFQGLSRHTYAHFDARHSPSAPTMTLPAIIHLRGRFERFDAEFEEAVSWSQTQPRRAQARLWELLWQLPSIAATANVPNGGHPVIDRAQEWIELHLGEPFALSDVAAAVDISHGHLIRLFHEHHSTTPLGYVHARRAKRAEHLLRHTTLTIKSIARQVGLADVQQLNKLLRKVIGRSPRAVRAAR